MNPCAVPGQISGISPSATHLRICSGQGMDNFFNLWPPEMLWVFITGQWHLYSFWTFIHRFGYRNWKYRLTFVFNLAFGYRQGCLYICIQCFMINVDFWNLCVLVIEWMWWLCDFARSELRNTYPERISFFIEMGPGPNVLNTTNPFNTAHLSTLQHIRCTLALKQFVYNR